MSRPSGTLLTASAIFAAMVLFSLLPIRNSGEIALIVGIATLCLLQLWVVVRQLAKDLHWLARWVGVRLLRRPRK